MNAGHAGALLAGVLAALGAHAQARLPGGWLPVAVLLAAGLVLALLPRLRPLALLCAGFLLAWWPLWHYDQACLRVDFDERVLVSAKIEGLPLRRGADEYFTALLAPLRPGALPAPSVRARLRWPSAPPLHAGERWQLLVALHAPSASANPGSASAATQTLRLRLHAAGQVLASALDRRLSAAPASLDALRERIALAVAAQVAERDAAALIIALAVGDTQRVSVEQWRVFNAVGITHLVAISGLHVTMFCQLCAWLAGLLWRRSAWLQARVPRHSCAALLGLLAALGYALLAGWSVPTQRTLLMLATWHGLRIAARPRPPARTLATGLVGVLLLDPLAPLAAGFWLSFIAVGVLLLQGAILPRASSGWRELLRTQGYLSAALLPVTVAVFGSVSLAGLVVNLLAIPAFGLVLVPVILSGTAALGPCPALGTALLKLAAFLIGAGWPALHALAASPFSLLHAAPPAWWYLLAAAAAPVALLPWTVWMRATALLALVPAAFPAAASIAAGSFAATVFDVGRGSAVLVRTAGHALLLDDGEIWGSGGAIAATRLVPALRHYGVRALDAVLLPRLDADRGAGVLALAASLPVRALLAGAGRELPPEFAPCRPGGHWRWDGVDFEWLDAASCALRVSVAGASLWLPETAALDLRPRPPAARAAGAVIVLVAGGRRPAARSAELIAATGAQLALLSADARSAHGATASASLRVWRAAGARTLVTGSDGAVELHCAPGGTLYLASW